MINISIFSPKFLLMAYYFEKSGTKALNELIDTQNVSKIIVITDTNTRKYCLKSFQSASGIEFINVNIKPGDVNKNLDTITEVWKKLMISDVDRNSLIINLGGGVVTDLGGFAAATFKRGVKFIHIPTSLLGMVDAAIGGKNGINFMEAKNQIGTIKKPEFVWFYTDFLKTLSKEEFDSGFAEMLKHGLICDRQYWNDLFRYYKKPNNKNLSQLIKTSVKIKDNIIKKDPYEQGMRKLLNYGHTIGHALESYMNYRKNISLSHGKAVAAGMIIEAFLSYKLNGLPKNDLNEIMQIINFIYPVIKLNTNDVEEIIKLMRFDKKNEKGKVKYVLLNKIGKANFNKEAPETLIYEAFEFYQNA